jgi:hypothetical protein
VTRRRRACGLPVFGLVAALLVVGAAPAWAEGETCRASPALAGGCFTVHARLTACTGIPNARLWIVGTKRILGVVDPRGSPAGAPLLPAALEEAMFSATPCSKAAWGDFTVCPLTPDRPGHMREVCVAEAARVVITDW